MLPIDTLALRFEPTPETTTMLIPAAAATTSATTAHVPLSPVSPSLSLSPFDLSQCGDSDLGLFLSQRMELVWHGEFDRLFAQYYPQAWYLVPTFYPPAPDRWQVFKDSAKVRFSCADCGHGWTSMKGRVVFWFHLNFATNLGYVLFKLYGQQCQKCNNGKFEHAMWYPEEVVKVVGNVYNRVGQSYYGFFRPPLRIDRRQGKPRNQHNAELCQACKEGLCREEWAIATATANANANASSGIINNSSSNSSRHSPNSTNSSGSSCTNGATTMLSSNGNTVVNASAAVVVAAS